MRSPFRVPGPLPACLALLAALGACQPREQPPETPPQQISESTFHYPDELWDDSIEGRTVLRVYVSDVGRVDTVQVEESSGYAAFDSAAVRGAPELRFEPARRGDESVGVWVLLPVQFDMRTAPAQPRGAPNPQEPS
jgi:TonB family protein